VSEIENYAGDEWCRNGPDIGKAAVGLGAPSPTKGTSVT